MKKMLVISLCIGIMLLCASCGRLPDISKDQTEDSYNSVITDTSDIKDEVNETNESNEISNNEESSLDNQQIPLTIQEVSPIISGLTLISNDKFTVKIPEGWEIETTGEYETLGFRAYDPNNPARQIFYYGKMDPFLKSYEAKDFYKDSILTGGSGYEFYANAPVLNPPTTEEFFHQFNAFSDYAYQYGINHNFSSLNDLKFIESTERNSPFSNYVTDEKILRGFFTQDDVYCEGQFAASLYDAISYDAYGIDTGFYNVYMISGVTAPADEYPFIQKQLVEAIASFQYTQAYIDEGVRANQTETEQIINMGKAIQESYDTYNRAWENRQLTYDVLSQKQSDATLGYTRVVDTVTGETYKAENEFYEQYQSNPNSYENPYLKAIEDDDYDSYLNPITGYIGN